MPVSQMRNGLTAEKSIFSQKPSISVPRSKFDYGRLSAFTADIGMIIPVDCFPTLPNEDYNLSCQYKIDWRPLLVPTLTSYKVKLHYYYCPNEYLWSGWETFISKGRSGNLILSVPTIKLSELTDSVKFSGLTDPNFKTADGSYYPYVPHSLISYLVGSPAYQSKLVNEDGGAISGAVPDHYLPFGNSANTMQSTGYKALDCNALPFLMYQKIFRSNYLDPNLYDNGVVSSPVWFPVDIDSSHWRFNYACSNLGGSYNEFFVPDTIASVPSSPVANFVPFPETGSSDGDTAVNLTQLRYSMYTDDMFTTALPFLQRGTQPSLEADVSEAVISGKGYFKNDHLVNDNSVPEGAFWSGDNITRTIGHNSLFFFGGDARASGYVFGGPNPFDASIYTSHAQYVRPYVDGSSYSVSDLSVSFTAAKLRDLIAVSVWQERNALTNGSYGQFIKVHYDKYPDNSFFEPIYIGGTSSVFDVSALLQTSQSTDGNPLGNPAGVGGSSNSQSIGRFHSNDFGFIMALMTIIPDTFYVQSQEHWMYELSPDDYYMPEFEKLSYQPILNKSLYVSGNSDDDNGLFGYSNRYVYLKQRDNIARGQFALPTNVDAYMHSYVQSRQFEDTPKLSQHFVTCYPPNIDRSMLVYDGEPAFYVQFYSGVEKVSPMSFVSQPNTFGF